MKCPFKHGLLVSECASKPEILALPERLGAWTRLRHFAFTTDLLHHSAEVDRLYSLFKGQNQQAGFVHTSVLIGRQRRNKWHEAGEEQATVRHRARIKCLAWRNIYQPWPEGRFSAPVVPPCLKDDTIYTLSAWSKQKTNSFILLLLQDRAVGS